MPVAQALIAQGLISAEPTGLQSLSAEWAWREEWTYETTFEWSEEDERCQLELPPCAGARIVRLNGRALALGGAGDGCYDLSEGLSEGENRLEIACRSPEDAPSRRPAFGLVDAVWLRAGNDMTLSAFSLSADGRQICARVRVHAYAAGRYAFQYAVALGEEPASAFSFHERLRPGERTIEHALPIKNPAFFDAARSEDTFYTVRLDIERAGAACQLAFGKVLFLNGGKAPLRLCALPMALEAEALEGDLAWLRALGADGLACREFVPERGFLHADAQELPPSACDLALASAETIRSLAGGERHWPPFAPVWLLEGSPVKPLAERMEKLFGTNAMGDMARACRMSRYLQAENLRDRALRARLDAAPLCVHALRDETPRYASAALIEADGRARPAFHALSQAWRPIAVHAALPEGRSASPGARLRIPIWLLAGDVPRDTATLALSCYRLDGTLLTATSLVATLGEDAVAGELIAQLPQESCALVVRAEVSDSKGQMIAREDTVLCVSQDEPLSPLMNLAPARLRREGDALVNEGRDAALGVSAQGYRALLPGERMPVGEVFECLNGLM